MITCGKFSASADEGLMVVTYDGEEVAVKSARNSDNIEEIMKICFKLGQKDIKESVIDNVK